MELQGKSVVVVGLGTSGLAGVRLLSSKGAKVTINDSRQDLGDLGAEAKQLGASFSLGDHAPERFADAQLIVVSPGVPPLPALADAARRGVPVVSEIELASWFISAPIVGITGTNGKSTVTTLIGKMCEATGKPTFTGGNLGTPLSVAVGTPAASDGYVVVELSSFQLERVEKFHAKVGVLLNVTDDHLDRYENLAAYAAAKGRLFTTQHKDGFAIAPAGDQLCMSLAYGSPGSVASYAGSDGEVRRQGDAIVDSVSGMTLPIEELGIRGEHNIDNACAAALAGRLLGLDSALIVQALREFKGLPHRMQHVATLQGVAYFDDSKATNVGAAVAALQGFARAKKKVVLIAGGKDKGGSYEPLRATLEKVGAGLVLIGEASDLIATAFQGSPLPVARAGSMSEAVVAAHKLARFGEVVLLAPACSSFDMFKSYAHRGDVFRDAVLALQEEQGS